LNRLGLITSFSLHAGLICVAAAATSRPDAEQRRRPGGTVTVALLSARQAALFFPPAALPASASPNPAPPVRRRRPVRHATSAAITTGHPTGPATTSADEPAAVASGGGEPGAARAAGVDGLSREQRQRALDRYLDEVLRPITARTLYPDEAERLGLEGSFVLRIAVDSGGRLVAARLLGSPPHALLQRSAFAALAASVPLPPPPAELGAVVEVDVPFVYRLDG
jgi:TonB family protein